MKVGKPKSKRTPVRLRHKIQKASASKERKRRKDAKKNPQWVSRLKKDPGIPNLFPYKAQVLADIEEGKRKKQEEAQRRRDVAKAQRQGRAVEEVTQTGAKTSGEPDEDDDEVLSDVLDDGDEDESMDEQDDSNPMAALLASAQARANTFTQDNDNGEDGEEDDGEDEEWNGVADTKPTIASAQAQQKGLPKQALKDPIQLVSKLLDRVQGATGGLQILLDYYQIPPLVTASSDLGSRFLVEVARKRGRLGKGGVPNLRSAALTVLGDLNDQRLVLPSLEKSTSVKTDQGEVKIVQRMAEPFRIEGLWGEQSDGGPMIVETDLTTQA